MQSLREIAAYHLSGAYVWKRGELRQREHILAALVCIKHGGNNEQRREASRLIRRLRAL